MYRELITFQSDSIIFLSVQKQLFNDATQINYMFTSSQVIPGLLAGIPSSPIFFRFLSISAVSSKDFGSIKTADVGIKS